MATSQRQPWAPDWAVAPGEVLVEALGERAMTQAELARRMARPLKTISEIANGKAAITPETAIQLERVLGIGASFWNGLEARYREALAGERARKELEDQVSWANQFPVTAMVKHALLPSKSEGPDRIADLLTFFQVSSPLGWQQHWAVQVASYRLPRSETRSEAALAAWLRWGEIVAANIHPATLDPGRLVDAVPGIRSLTRLAAFPVAIERLRRICAEAGVVAVYVPELPGARVSGAARWTREGVPVIQVTLRYRADDQFWHTVFHELGHIIRDPRRETRVEDRETPDEATNEPDIEAAADLFARDALIPPAAYDSFVQTGDFSPRAVREFAKEIGVSPGVVAGRLGHDYPILRTRLARLKRMYPEAD
jgi:addiction module HigA family antidote